MSPEFSVLSVANFKAADRPAIPDPRIRTWGVRGGTERSFKREWDGVMLPLMRGYIALGTARQDRTRSIHHRFLLLALITFSVVMGMIFVESRRSSVIARARQASESRELDERFVRGSDHLEARLDELKTQSRHAVTTGDRHRLPLGVVSVSSWARTPTGIVRAFGFEAEGVWEQALYRVLPAEIAKHQSPAVLPLVGPGLLNDPSAETLRLGFFPEKEGAEITVIAFRPSVLFAGFLGNDATKRYLIEESGLVLAHTNASEVGERTSALADFYRRAEKVSDEPSKAHRLLSKSWEGFPSTIRFARLPGWNAFFVMEKVHAPVQAALNPLLILICIAGSLLGTLFLGLAFMRPKPRRGLCELRLNPPAFIPRPSAPVVEIASELGKFIAAREAKTGTHELNRIRREKILLEEFETDARRTREVPRLEKKLVESVSGATKSPVLFFRYDPKQGIARLTAEAGYPSSQSIIDAGGMSFALETGLVTEIHAEVARGRQKNLWEYAPLGRIMLSRLGIAGFEAWSMTEARNPNAGPSRLLGVLVIAESGFESVLHREFLGTLLDRASRHYARQNG